MDKGKPISVWVENATRIVAIAGDAHYIWTAGVVEVTDRIKTRNAYEDANPSMRVETLAGVLADYDTDHAFLFYVADCFSPPVYLVFGRSFEDAYQTFITDCEHLIKIESADLPDYGDNFSTNDNGTAVDTESVQYIAIDRLIVECKPPRE